MREGGRVWGGEGKGGWVCEEGGCGGWFSDEGRGRGMFFTFGNSVVKKDESVYGACILLLVVD